MSNGEFRRLIFSRLAAKGVQYQQRVDVQNLDHLGIIAGLVDELEIVEQFLIGKATEQLLGEGVLAEHLNDDR